MRKSVAAAAIAPLLLVGLAACSSNGSGGAASATAVNTNPPSSPKASGEIDKYCAKVKAYVAKAQGEVTSGKPTSTPEISTDASAQESKESLAAEGTALETKYASDTAGVQQIQKCSDELTKVPDEIKPNTPSPS